MTPIRLVAIGAIFFCTTIAWMILGGTIVDRTGESDGRIRQEVEALWGREHRQEAPAIVVERLVTRRIVTETVTKGVTSRVVTVDKKLTSHPADLIGSAVTVRLDLEHRKKGLLWWPTYNVDFAGSYRFDLPPALTPANDVVDVVEEMALTVPMSARGAVYDGFFVKVNGVETRTAATGDNSFVVSVPRGTNVDVTIDVAYRSRGLGTWVYGLASGGTAQLRDFALTLLSSDANIDFPVGTLSPTTRVVVDGGARLEWRFTSLVTGQDIGVELPQRLNPGPVAARIAFFAPVSLLFFMTVMVIVGVIKKRSLHPMNYFFLAGAFFAFHLLFAYLVDVVDLAVAFTTSSVVSLALVTSYLRIVQGAKAAFLQAGTAQLIFLVGFSLAFFHEGQTGLTVAIGAVVTLFVLMQLTARVQWGDVFGGGDIEAGPMGGAPVGVPGLGAPRARPSPSSSLPTPPGAA